MPNLENVPDIRRSRAKQEEWKFVFCYPIVIFLVFLLLIITGIDTAAAAPTTPSAEGLETIRLHFRWFHQFQFAGYYAAVKKGYYRQAGFEVTFVERLPSKEIIDIIQKSPGTYGVSNSEILHHRFQGKPLVVLAAIFQHSPAVLLTHKETGITHPQDLVGKRLMIENKFKNSEIWAMIYNEGVPPRSIH